MEDKIRDSYCTLVSLKYQTLLVSFFICLLVFTVHDTSLPLDLLLDSQLLKIGLFRNIPYIILDLIRNCE